MSEGRVGPLAGQNRSLTHDAMGVTVHEAFPLLPPKYYISVTPIGSRTRSSTISSMLLDPSFRASIEYEIDSIDPKRLGADRYFETVSATSDDL